VADVDLARRLLFGQNQNKKELPGNLRLYVYSPKENDDIFRLSARCNVPYASLATLNRLSGPNDLFEKSELLLPTVPGLYLSETPDTDLEQLIAAGRTMDEGTVITIPGRGRFLFFPGADFSPTERSYFLNPGFHFPLRNYRISSPFGMRPSPFTGKPEKHNGLDLAAPAGTEVYPAREGRVIETGTDAVYGNYIIVAHQNNWASLYGHLSSILVKPDSSVTRNSIIGKVGSSGQSTGPHLHFELRKNGTALDPGKLLFGK
jgi:murein DD-endopeptidase MepM/ murein hydrolase activator NlpD